mgnify:CR=1 FL=1
MDTGSGSDIDYLISIPHDIFVMFDNDNRVPEIHQFSEIIEQETTIPRMETDRGFVEDIGDSFESRTHLCRETDSL